MILAIWFLLVLTTTQGYIEVRNYKFKKGETYNATVKSQKSPPYIIYFTNLKGTLYQESLSSLPVTVKKLWIENSKLDEIKDGALCSSPLEEITLFHTTTRELTSASFGNCTSLKKITISSYNTDIANDTFSELTSLKNIVILSHLPRIPKTLFSGLALLESLSVVHSGVESIEEATFDDLVSLQYLDLTDNKIESFNRTVRTNLTKLLTLELSSNLLEEFPWDDLVHLGQLESLNFDRNKMGEVDEERIIKFLPRLKVLNFQHNNMSCGEVMEKIGAIRANISDIDIPDYRCTNIK